MSWSQFRPSEFDGPLLLLSVTAELVLTVLVRFERGLEGGDLVLRLKSREWDLENVFMTTGILHERVSCRENSDAKDNDPFNPDKCFQCMYVFAPPTDIIELCGYGVARHRYLTPARR